MDHLFSVSFGLLSVPSSPEEQLKYPKQIYSNLPEPLFQVISSGSNILGIGITAASYETCSKYYCFVFDETQF